MQITFGLWRSFFQCKWGVSHLTGSHFTEYNHLVTPFWSSHLMN